MDGVADEEEDVNADGKYNIVDCLPENLQQQIVNRQRRQIERVSVTSEVNDESLKEVEAACPEGYTVIGGGFALESASANWLINVSKSYPSSDITWLVQAEAPALNTEEWSVTAWAICDASVQ
jgi:hypothetical protein